MKLQPSLWRRRALQTTALAAAALFALNALAWSHARRMTHFAPAGHGGAPLESPGLIEKAGMVLWGVSLPRPVNSHTPADHALTYEDHRVRTADGIELAVWRVPHPDPLGAALLYHSYGACKDTLLPQAAALHGLGFEVWMVDFRGSGESSGATTTIGVAEALDVAATVEYARGLWVRARPWAHSSEARQTAPPLVLYGASMGAAAVLRACAVLEVQADALILESPFDTMVNTTANRFRAMGLPAFPGARLLVFWGGIQHGFNGFAHRPMDYAAQVRIPALLLHGALDTRVTREQSEAIFSALAGPKVMSIVESRGHGAICRDAPGAWTETAARFLEYAGVQIRRGRNGDSEG